MTVIINIKKENKSYCWEQLSEAQRKDIRHSLNRQTAKQLGYEPEEERRM